MFIVYTVSRLFGAYICMWLFFLPDLKYEKDSDVTADQPAESTQAEGELLRISCFIFMGAYWGNGIWNVFEVL